MKQIIENCHSILAGASASQISFVSFTQTEQYEYLLPWPRPRLFASFDILDTTAGQDNVRVRIRYLVAHCEIKLKTMIFDSVAVFVYDRCWMND